MKHAGSYRQQGERLWVQSKPRPESEGNAVEPSLTAKGAAEHWLYMFLLKLHQRNLFVSFLKNDIDHDGFKKSFL